MYPASLLFIIAISVSSSLCSTAESQLFEDFKHRYQKSYSSVEEEHRFAIFKTNLLKIEQLQSQHTRTNFGLTKFSDLSEEEFSQLLGDHSSDFSSSQPGPLNYQSSRSPIATSCNPQPNAFDWSSCGVVGSIRDQGECGSPVVFPVVESVESYCALSKPGRTFTSLSVQQVMDCESNTGCDGGLINANEIYVYTMRFGLETEAAYPIGGNGTCSYDRNDVYPCSVTGWQDIVGGNKGIYRQLSVSSGGPVVACLDAGSTNWQFYTSGVIESCGDSVDFCLQVTGYGGYGTNQSYFILRNSWGVDWGMDGFAWVSMDGCSLSNGSFPIIG